MKVVKSQAKKDSRTRIKVDSINLKIKEPKCMCDLWSLLQPLLFIDSKPIKRVKVEKIVRGVN